jgi:hypothetical protein
MDENPRGGLGFGGNVLMMMMLMCLGALRLLSGCQSARVIIGTIFALELPSPPLSLAGNIVPRILQVITLNQGGACKRPRGWRDGTGATHGAHSAADAREHAAKLALDAGFSGRARLLRLRALYSLGQRGYATLPVLLLDR